MKLFRVVDERGVTAWESQHKDTLENIRSYWGRILIDQI